MPMHSGPLELDALAVVRIRGADAVPFLQGQLSNDLTRLEREPALFAGLHNPQGRVIALLRLAALEREDLLAVLPRELAAPVTERLRRFVLRAKVTVADESASWRVLGIRGTAVTGLALPLPGGERTLELIAGERAAAPAQELQAWHLEDIAAGLPQVYAATSEAFVAQMLNLDLLDGVSFDKGCYTGQEVIARAHYRGRVKRRLQRFATLAPGALRPGDSGHLADGRSFRVVEAARRPDGRCEFLAVAPLAAEGPAPAEEPPAAAGAPLAVEALALPYALPE